MQIDSRCAGSSPRVRGTPRRSPRLGRCRRFIPARAGNACWRALGWGMDPVHPRACGERSAEGSSGGEVDGSSPRVRGTRGDGDCRAASRRFIPARAGNAARRRLVCLAPPVHPRACGERSRVKRSEPRNTGSSPRVRGTPEVGPGAAQRPRFIPARAGNAVLRRRPSPPNPVHPRACGERFVLPQLSVVDCGSSPRVRGTRTTSHTRALTIRFIPARAGNALAFLPMDRARAVHPRACGERARTGKIGRPGPGSSPRVRGTPHGHPVIVDHERFSPARAGNARLSPATKSRRAVHPRACGERPLVSSSVTLSAGSSPRVRGTLDQDGIKPARALGSSPRVRGTLTDIERIKEERRFIPARAGNAWL